MPAGFWGYFFVSLAGLFVGEEIFRWLRRRLDHRIASLDKELDELRRDKLRMMVAKECFKTGKPVRGDIDEHGNLTIKVIE